MWVPEEGSEALRDLVRAREAAKQDQSRARHRLSKFLLRTGQRPAPGVKPWTLGYMAWVRQLRFEHVAQESTRLDYLHQVEHMAERVLRLEQAVTEAVKLASPELKEVIKGLQALRGVAQTSAVTIAAELGNISRFDTARQLMSYSGAVERELQGFIWAIGIKAEAASKLRMAAWPRTRTNTKTFQRMKKQKNDH